MNRSIHSSPEIKVGGVCERDVDLMLLGELTANTPFVQWLTAELGFDEAVGAELARVERSASQANGESDLEVLLIHPHKGKRYMLMLENKIVAGFQPHQAERYRERGECYVAQGVCNTYRTALIAPQKYLGSDGSSKGFDAALSYERLLDWMSTTYVGQPRLTYLSRMLNAAIDKASYVWKLLEDEAVSDFWRSYWEISSEVAPELELPQPTPKPARSSFIYFHPTQIARPLSLIHKVTYGKVDLQFADFGEHTNRLRQAVAQYLDADMKVVRARKSAAVRILVPAIEMSIVGEMTFEAIQSGISAAKRLLAWYCNLPDEVKSQALTPSDLP